VRVDEKVRHYWTEYSYIYVYKPWFILVYFYINHDLQGGISLLWSVHKSKRILHDFWQSHSTSFVNSTQTNQTFSDRSPLSSFNYWDSSESNSTRNRKTVTRYQEGCSVRNSIQTTQTFSNMTHNLHVSIGSLLQPKFLERNWEGFSIHLYTMKKIGLFKYCSWGVFPERKSGTEIINFLNVVRV